MANEWRDLLHSDNPAERAQAVKMIALSGNHDNLQYLKNIVENDPDPRLREYARKAARHLYSSLQAPQQEAAPLSPVGSDKKTKRESTSSILPNPSDPKDNKLPQAVIQEAEGKVQRAFSLHTRGQTKKALQLFAQALELNPELKKDSFARSVALEITGLDQLEAFRSLEDHKMLNKLIDAAPGRGKTPRQKIIPASTEPKEKTDQDGRSRSNLIMVWLNFFHMTESFFQDEMEKANNEDTFLSVMVYTITAVLIFLISGFFQIQQITTLMEDQLPQLSINLGMIFFFILIGTVILTPLSFYLTVGMQYLGVRLFGGSGEYKTHAYLMALIQVPVTILGGVLSMLAFIPIVWFISGLAGFGLSIYSIILTVRSAKAAHNVTTAQAIGGIIVPPLILALIGGCLLMTLGSTLAGVLSQLQ